MFFYDKIYCQSEILQKGFYEEINSFIFNIYHSGNSFYAI